MKLLVPSNYSSSDMAACHLWFMINGSWFTNCGSWLMVKDEGLDMEYKKSYKKQYKKSEASKAVYKPKRGPLSKLMTEEEKQNAGFMN